MEGETIKICSSHQSYQTPLIWTFAFAYNEYWCPYCGKNEGMLGAGEEVQRTKELEERLEKYKKRYREYLHANGITYAVRTTWKGEKIHPRDLPEEEKSRLKKIREEDWKEKIEIEKI